MTNRDHWPIWAQHHYPTRETSREEIAAWKPITFRYALASTALAVATTRIEGTWCAYCAGVPGNNHDREEADVLDYGCKLAEPVALALFPLFKGVPYAE